MEFVKGKSAELDVIYEFAYRKKGIDLRSYRSTFLLRRLKIRMSTCKMGSIADYVKVLEESDAEWNAFLNALSINVSEFFRDPDVFERFRDVSLKELISRKHAKSQRVMRFWSAGCAHGEEAYSVAIMLREALGGGGGFVVKVIATDMDRDALDIALRGEYRRRALRNVSQSLLEKYFLPAGEDRWIVRDEIKAMVKFKQHNVLKDPPLKNVDVIFFRNVRIYFSLSEANEILRKMNDSLNEGGYLVMGKVEGLPVPLREYFVAVDNYCKIYQKRSKKGGSDGESFGC